MKYLLAGIISVICLSGTQGVLFNRQPEAECPFRHVDRQPEPEATPEVKPEPEVVPEGPSPLVFVGVGFLGAAIGFGVKFYETVKSK